MVVTLLEGDTPFKITLTFSTAKMRAEALVFQPPLAAAQSALTADITIHVHFLFIDVGVFQVTNIIILEGDPAVEIIVAGVDIASQQFFIIQRLEA